MVFSSLLFLYVFLPLNLAFYALAKDIRTKNTVMLIFSLVFYAWGEPVYVLLLVGMALADWLLSHFIGKNRGTGKAKLGLVLACVIDLGLLAVFKYAGFLLGNAQALFGVPSFIPEIALPIGISFYTFQLLSYVVDVYRGEVEPQKKFRTLLLYVSLFHQCIAGPIVRYSDVERELTCRHASWRDMSDGLTRFTVGLAKKALLANTCGVLADSFLVKDSAGLTGEALEQANMLLSSRPALALWLGMFAYMLQIYLDFSAYSDMAIGMGRMIGFHYKENFDYPYCSKSVGEFWRRWHISLGSFFRDYVYIPLGGNRRGRGRMFFNMFIVWALTGLWHGASWNFVLWGLYFFVFLVFERTVLQKLLARAPAFLSRFYLLAVVYFGWILFRFRDIGQVGTVLSGMFTGRSGFTSFETNVLLGGYAVFFVIAVIAVTPVAKLVRRAVARLEEGGAAAAAAGTGLRLLFPVALLLLSTAALVGDSYNPFLYFQF